MKRSVLTFYNYLPRPLGCYNPISLRQADTRLYYATGFLLAEQYRIARGESHESFWLSTTL